MEHDPFLDDLPIKLGHFPWWQTVQLPKVSPHFRWLKHIKSNALYTFRQDPTIPMNITFDPSKITILPMSFA